MTNRKCSPSQSVPASYTSEEDQESIGEHQKVWDIFIEKADSGSGKNTGYRVQVYLIKIIALTLLTIASLGEK